LQQIVHVQVATTHGGKVPVESLQVALVQVATVQFILLQVVVIYIDR